MVPLHGFKPETVVMLLHEELISHVHTDINQLSYVWDGPF